MRPKRTAGFYVSMLVKKPLPSWAQRCALLLCLLFPLQGGTARFVEINAEIDLICYRTGETNVEATAKPKTISVV